jgi:hypothetical protein
MANAIYPKACEQMLQGGIDLLSDDVKLVLVDADDYTYNAAHEFLSSIPAGARVATSPNLGSKTVTNGLFNAGNTSFSSVSGDISEAVVVFIDTGDPDTSRLIAYLDTGHTGLPITPDGNNINVTIASGLFQLASTVS